jgi:hypothetical protein
VSNPARRVSDLTVEELRASNEREYHDILHEVIQVLKRGPNYSCGIVDALGLPIQRGTLSQRSIRIVRRALQEIEKHGHARSWLVLPEGGGMLRRYYELVDP